jgi:uncharacterized protein YndB with AHSA1/START domain
MSLTRRTIDAAPDRVWAVLLDGWSYPLWVVGASRMREVDVTWPKEGSSLHHSVGAWPLLLDDRTTVEECLPEQLLRLTAYSRPLGRAEVAISLVPAPVDDGREGTIVTLREDATTGPALLVPRPVRAWLLHRRNREALDRLAFLAEGRR